MQLIVISVEYLIAMFTMLERHIRQKVAVVLAGQGGRPSANNHFGWFQLKQSVTIENDFRRLVS
jgi:hypothetical protein